MSASRASEWTSKQQLLDALKDVNADVQKLNDQELQALWNGGYRTSRLLRCATGEGLKEAGLPPATVGHLLGRLGGLALGTCSRATSTDDLLLCQRITSLLHAPATRGTGRAQQPQGAALGPQDEVRGLGTPLVVDLPTVHESLLVPGRCALPCQCCKGGCGPCMPGCFLQQYNTVSLVLEKQRAMRVWGGAPV